MVRKIDTVRGDSALGSWIYRIVANAAQQRLRGRAHRSGEIPLEDVIGGGENARPSLAWSFSPHRRDHTHRRRFALKTAA